MVQGQASGDPTLPSGGEVEPPHSVIGVALVLGFLFMFLVDQLGTAYTMHYQTLPQSEVETNRHPRITATLGLVVHAAADGIALGAAATTSHADIEMIVFTAIMLHKAPAAFGLVTFLMHEGLDRMRIRRHLLVFALSAPLMALCTYFGISQSTKERLSSLNATGIAMLFSAGTFLYVATVHVLPEISHTDSPRTLRKSELVALVAGSLLPLLLSVDHHH
ncbi:SLC39A9 [Cordylochernes scorpioides]|uniref:SLC39A9 n=1 Tax=Cordylochernes scorpioides TaxID=51811 RepID=A0ABY6K5F8_9ARAC|nr:SLC39A9 [Cordylochernes scorpioides]